MAFDHLLTCCIGYRDLDDRLRLTITKRHALLRVRGEPTLPLTNNPAEFAVRSAYASATSASTPARRTQDLGHAANDHRHMKLG